MRVLFTTWAWPSHYYPMVPLAWAFRTSGHEVRVASQPGFAEEITQSGLTAVAVGSDVDVASWARKVLAVGEAPGEMRTSKGERAVRMFADLAENMADDLHSFATAWRPDLIVFEPTTYAGPIVAAALGLPSVRHVLGVDFSYRARPWEGAALAPLAARFGLPAADTLGTITVDPCPASLQLPVPVSRANMRYVPYNGPGTVPDWLLDPPARPRVCVTWGNSSGRLDPRMVMIRTVIEAISDLDVEIVAAVGADEPELGEGVRVVRNLPLHLLLPSCDLLIAQGGLGTMLTGLCAGLPQLIIPQLPETVCNAEQLSATGAGTFLHREQATPAAIRAGVADLLDKPGYRESAERLRQEIEARPSPLDVVADLTALAGAR
ncbi:nucleotide disphospho-sugar-binding domain-containing protein [Crossiella sp. NPDC003009]